MREMWGACCRSQTGQIAVRYHIWVLFSYRTGHISFRTQRQWKFSFRKKNLSSTYSLKGVMNRRWMWKLMLHKREFQKHYHTYLNPNVLFFILVKRMYVRRLPKKKKCWNLHWQSTQRVKGPRKGKRNAHMCSKTSFSTSRPAFPASDHLVIYGKQPLYG